MANIINKLEQKLNKLFEDRNIIDSQIEELLTKKVFPLYEDYHAIYNVVDVIKDNICNDSGVYLLMDENFHPIRVGQAYNIRNRILQHFQNGLSFDCLFWIYIEKKHNRNYVEALLANYLNLPLRQRSIEEEEEEAA